MKSMLGKWNKWYKGVGQKGIILFRDSDSTTYRIAGEFLADMKTVEDWGCGFGGFRPFYTGHYIGIDGTSTPFVDKIADLRNYTSTVEGIMMRHVLEHNYEWKKVLSNAMSSFSKKMCLILFTPLSVTTMEIAHNKINGVDVPDIAFKQEDIEYFFEGCEWEVQSYKGQHIFLITKKRTKNGKSN